MKQETRLEEMRAIHDEVLKIDTQLAAFRKENNYFPVIGQGAHDAQIVFVGEAPGEQEAKTGVPFCGRSGKFLDQMLGTVKISRDTVYITNVVKDRPPQNRDPKPEEIAKYAPFLDRQIDIIQPTVVATLGRFAMEYLMNRYGLERELGAISQLHGKVFEAEFPYGKGKLIALYHPAVALYNPSQKEVLLEDFKIIKDIIETT